MFTFDFFLNIPLKLLGLAPIFSQNHPILKCVSLLYSTVIFVFVLYGEYDFIYRVYVRSESPDMKAEGLEKYTYFTRDVICLVCTSIDLVANQIFHSSKFKTELKGIEVDKIINRQRKMLTKSVAFFVIFFSAWMAVMVWYLLQMIPFNIYHGISMTISTLDAFNIMISVEKLYLRFYEVNINLESTVNECKEMYKIKDTSKEAKYIQRIRTLGDCHVELCQIVDETSRNFGTSMLFLLLLIMINLIAFSNCTLVSGIKHNNTNLAAKNACWVVLYVLLVYILLYSGTKVIDEAYRTQEIIWDNILLGSEPALISEMELLTLKTLHNKYSIDCGYFDLSLDTFGTMTNSVLTQIIIIYTFQI